MCTMQFYYISFEVVYEVRNTVEDRLNELMAEDSNQLSPSFHLSFLVSSPSPLLLPNTSPLAAAQAVES